MLLSSIYITCLALVCLKSRITLLQLILPRSLRERIPSCLSSTLKDRFLDLFRFPPPMKFADWHLQVHRFVGEKRRRVFPDDIIPPTKAGILRFWYAIIASIKSLIYVKYPYYNQQVLYTLRDKTRAMHYIGSHSWFQVWLYPQIDSWLSILWYLYWILRTVWK